MPVQTEVCLISPCILKAIKYSIWRWMFINQNIYITDGKSSSTHILPSLTTLQLNIENDKGTSFDQHKVFQSMGK